MCGVDSHGRVIDLGLELRGWHTVIDAPMPKNRKDIPAALIEAISRGRFHCVAGLFALDPEFEFLATWGGELAAAPGDTVTTAAVDALETRGPRSTVDTATIVLLRNGQEVARTQGGRLRYRDPTPGTYRVEVRLPIPGVLYGYRVVPVIYSNRIRVVDDADAATTGPPARLFPLGRTYPELPSAGSGTATEPRRAPTREPPEAEKPDAEKPEADKPEADKPEAEKPEAKKPKKPDPGKPNTNEGEPSEQAPSAPPGPDGPSP
jgi:hypothetical protein